MDTRLLKLAHRYRDGCRRWEIDGFVVTLLPSSFTPLGWGAAVYWPAIVNGEDVRRGVDLSRHRALAKRELQLFLCVAGFTRDRP